MLTCEIGDIFGCFEVISEPKIIGEHSYVKVKCTCCENEQELAISEIKNRPKQHCKFCRGESKRKYPDPQIGEIYNNWEVIENLGKINRFLFYNCKCTICGEIIKIRKDQLIKSPKQCPGCKTKAKNLKREKNIN